MQHIRNAVQQFLKTQPPARIIAIGFALLILCGAALLMLPFSVHPGVHITPLNALFTSTSAVCVTGLVVVDTGDTFSLFGQLVIAVLIQIGGLGVASIGMGLALVTGRRISLKGRSLVREALNVENLNGMVKLVRRRPAHDSAVRGSRRGAELSGLRPGPHAAAGGLAQYFPLDRLL